MDDVHFDQVTKLLRHGCSRRTLALLTASVVSGFGGTARAAGQGEGTVALQGTCRASGDCRPPGMALVICADNGIAGDGDLNCCVDRGCCTGDADCCGDMRCAPTPDVCSVCAFPPFPNRALGEACTADADCVPSVVSRIRCQEGRCAAPGEDAPFPPRARLDPEAALATAELLAQWEASADFESLYDTLHPDAQAAVPRAAVVGWYQDEFAPLGFAGGAAIKLRFVAWTWPVTGMTYRDVAEVTMRLQFRGQDSQREAVRLARDAAGDWRWFFGRDRAFVEAQIARYDPRGTGVGGGDLAALLPTLDSLPSELVMTEDRRRDLAEVAANYADPAAAEQQFAAWGWQENVIRRFGPDPIRRPPSSATSSIYVSLHRFADEEGATAALAYSADDQKATTNANEGGGVPIGDRSRVLFGVGENGTETTLYRTRGALLARITAGSVAGDPTNDAYAIATRFHSALALGAS